MKTITTDNIEAYILDYLEGNLNQFELDQLSIFLKKHPQYRALLNAEIYTLNVPEASSNKSKAQFSHIGKRADENPDLLAFDYTENLLNDIENQLVEELLPQHNSLYKEVIAFQSARLQPNLAIAIDKGTLIKDTAKKNPFRVVYYAAAVITVLIGISALLFQQKTNNYLPRTHQPHYTAFNLPEVKLVASASPNSSAKLSTALPAKKSSEIKLSTQATINTLPRKSVALALKNEPPMSMPMPITPVQFQAPDNDAEYPMLEELIARFTQLKSSFPKKIEQIDRFAKREKNEFESTVDLWVDKGLNSLKTKQKKTFTVFGKKIVVEPAEAKK